MHEFNYPLKELAEYVEDRLYPDNPEKIISNVENNNNNA